MSSRYDSRTTTFSPQGRLYQVEYAAEAIGQAGSAIGIKTTGGIVLATQKRAGHALLDTENLSDKHTSGEKVFKVAGHIGCAVAGITSDANILLNYARLTAHRHEYQYCSSIPVEDLCRNICDTKQGYTQYGGVRPFGVAFLMAGFDKYHGYQLYHTDPSGNYSSWEAYAIGESDAAAQAFLKQHWTDKLTLEEGKVLAARILQKTMDTTNLTTDRLEIAILSRGPRSTTSGTKFALAADDILHPYGGAGKLETTFTICDEDELKTILKLADEERVREEEEKVKKEQAAERNLAAGKQQ